MKSKVIPSELLSFVGILVRQARTARALSIGQAAIRTGLSEEDLLSLEFGRFIAATSDHLMYVLAPYGGVRSDAAEGLLFRLMLEESRCQAQKEKRKHLSLVGAEEPRPWEKMQYSRVTQGLD